jgi:TorA maturation chaperone TorD
MSGLCFMNTGKRMEDELKAELLALNLLRQVFLAEPTRKLLEGIGEIDFRPERETEQTGLRKMYDAVKKNESRLEEWTEQLSLEFARLFIGPAQPPAVPFASFYLSETPSLMSEETIAVRKQYLEAGVALKDLYQIPDDHIAIELDFLYYLTFRLLESSEHEKSAERQNYFHLRKAFLKDHFVLWVPPFAHRILESTREEYFIGAAWFLLETVQYYAQENY